jgi:hypothetical protein
LKEEEEKEKKAKERKDGITDIWTERERVSVVCVCVTGRSNTRHLDDDALQWTTFGLRVKSVI